MGEGSFGEMNNSAGGGESHHRADQVQNDSKHSEKDYVEDQGYATDDIF